MRLRCRFGIHLIDWRDDNFNAPRGKCVYCSQRFRKEGVGKVNLTKRDRARTRRQAKIANARDREET